MSVYDRLNFDLSRIPERQDLFMPNRPTVTDAPLSNVAQPPVFNQLTPEQQQALQNFQNPAPVQVDLGGGLGGFTMPQIPLETILANLPDVTPSLDFSNLPGVASTTPPLTVETLLDNIPENFQVNLPEDIDLTNLEPTIFGTPLAPSLPTPPTPTPAPTPAPTGLEDTGVSDEVVEDVVDTTTDYDLSDYMLVVGDPTNPGPGVVVRDPETGEFPPGYEVGNVEGPAGTIPPDQVLGTGGTGTGGTGTGGTGTDTVFSEPSPTIVDGGITTATPVVDDRNLITPNVEVPEGSMTGLGSYFTAPQINQIVDPGYSRPATTDMDRLLQMQRQTYGNFLYAPTPAPAPSPSTGTAPSEGDVGSGYVGTDYTTFPTDTTPRDYIDQLYNDPTGIQFNNIQNQMGMNPYSFDNIGNYYTGYDPAHNIQNNILKNIYNRGYGVMDFPVFSGITSLVPSDARATIGY